MVSDVHRESALPGKLHEFQEVEYWDSFFKLRSGRPFEWYGGWSDLQSYLSMLLPKSNNNAAAHILVAGCGNSALSAHLYDAGWPQVTNVDFSKVVIEEMLRMHVRSRPLMRWLVMDLTHLQVCTPSLVWGMKESMYLFFAKWFWNVLSFWIDQHLGLKHDEYILVLRSTGNSELYLIFQLNSNVDGL